MSNIQSTYQEIELQNGEKVKLTLNYAALYKLRKQNKDIYDRYNRLMQSNQKEDLDNITIVYVAYACAHIDEEYLTFTEFLEIAPYDRNEINDVLTMLIAPSAKKKDFQKHSGKLQKR